jgi:2-oxoisovalerate dehydrogenase E1 component
MALSNPEPWTGVEMTSLLRRAWEIRMFEERLLRLFAEGKLNGTVHTCLGQELSGLVVARAAGANDAVFSNHRGHGHYLAFRNRPDALLAEIMGRASGLCGGFGGSQHLHDRNFFSNGILGGMSPVAVGWAWARKISSEEGIAIVFHGDGAMGEGVVYEAMNLAAQWKLPVLWVVEKNGYAQSTSCRQTTAGQISVRAAGFGLSCFAGDTWNLEPLANAAEEAIRQVRSTSSPALLEIETYRLAAHSKGDDNRDPNEVAGFFQRDPLNALRTSAPELVRQWELEIGAGLDQLVARSDQAPDCQFHPNWSPRSASVGEIWEELPEEPAAERYSTLLHQTLARLFGEDPRLVMLGEDIEGPYGGAFKVTRDLSAKFPHRVRNTPISEAAIVGAGAGAALGGLRPIVEIMFGDFLSLTFDQLIQHACKFETMYGGEPKVPLIIRTPMGGRRGYGPTHSQSIEAHFMGIPELDVFALNARIEPDRVYRNLVSKIARPALVIENKILYTRAIRRTRPAGYRVLASSGDFPVLRITPDGIPPQVTLVCYGGMLDVAEEALTLAFEDHEIVGEVICPTRLVPLDLTPIRDSVSVTGRVVVLEEGKTFAAWGSEVLAALVEGGTKCTARRIGYDHFIPSSFTAETRLLPQAADVKKVIIELVHG